MAPVVQDLVAAAVLQARTTAEGVTAGLMVFPAHAADLLLQLFPALVVVAAHMVAVLRRADIILMYGHLIALHFAAHVLFLPVLVLAERAPGVQALSELFGLVPHAHSHQLM